MNIQKTSRLKHLICLLALALGISAPVRAGEDGTPGNGAPFTGIVAFGDSLTDTGNFFALTGIPPAPYADGRFSNGPVWIEQLAERMGLDPVAIENYAVGGATTGRDNENDIPGVAEFPGLQDELDAFKADLGGKKADKRALYVIWAGANDFFISTDPQATILEGIGNTLTAVQRLYNAGARRIMVVNLPDLGLTPLGQASGNAGALSFLSAAYNAGLDGALDALGIDTLRVDSAGLLQDMAAHPADYGFVNVTLPFLAVGGDPAGFLFWDAVHPTTTGHGYVAEEALSVLQAEYPHAWVTPRKLGN